MGICGGKSGKPFVPGQKAMERLEQEMREEEEKRLKEGENEGEKPAGIDELEEKDDRKGKVGSAVALNLKPEDVQLDIKDEGPELLKRTQTNQSLMKKSSIGNIVAERDKNIDEKRKTLVGISRETFIKDDKGGDKKSSNKGSPTIEPKLESKTTLKPKEESPEFRLIKMQSGESVHLIEPPSQIQKKGKQPQPKTESIKPGKGITGDNPHLSLTTNPILPVKIESSPNIEEKPIEKGQFFLSQKQLTEPKGGLESKPTTTQEKVPKEQVVTSKLEQQEKKEQTASDPKNNKATGFTPIKQAHLMNANDNLRFPTINELTEPDPSGIDRKSMNQNHELSSKNRKKLTLGESTLNFHLTVTPNTDHNLQLLRQNLEERNEVVAKPNFSSALLRKEVLQIMRLEEAANKREELNKEIVMVDMKKHEELYEMVRTDQYKHSQTKPSKVAGGWMEFEAEGEVWKDRT